MACLVRDFQILSTRAVWFRVPEHLCQEAIDAFKSNRSAMQGVPIGPSLSLDTFRALSECKAFRVLSNGRLAPASPALLLILRHGGAFTPATLDDCIIEELEELKPISPATPALAEL
jgi:hypothetical protein